MSCRSDRFSALFVPQKASDFIDLTDLLPGRIFVSIAVYVDESGTNDITGQKKGSEAAVLSGFVGWKANWKRFDRIWMDALELNGVKNFKFNEIQKSRNKPHVKTVYCEWTERRKDAFLLNLAKIASHHAAFPVGGNVYKSGVYEKSISEGKEPEYPYKRCFDAFFQSVIEEMYRVMPGCTEKVSFYFDQNQDPRWKNGLRESYEGFKKLDQRFVGMMEGDDKVLTPLQAADLLAGASRLVAVEAYTTHQRQPMNKLLQVLYQKMPNSTPAHKWITVP